MEESKQTFSELLSSIGQQNLPSAKHSPPQTPPAAFTYSAQNITTTSSLNLLSKIEPYYCSPSKISYIDLENESETFIQAQNPAKRLKQYSLAFSPYDRKEAKKEKMLEDIVSKSVNIKEKLILNPYLTNPAPEIPSRPLCESKSFDFEDMKSKSIVLDVVMTSIGWKEFCELDQLIYPNLVQQSYSSPRVLEGHDVILCFMNQTDIIITTDILYDKVESNRNSVIKEFFGDVKPAKDFPVTALKNEYKILHNLCTHSLLPRSSSRYRVNDFDLMILYHLTRGKRVIAIQGLVFVCSSLPASNHRNFKDR
ncbi:hypothetical protein MTR_0028s0290 [Medicago truncatula]|uniref:Uncharacterized protein n=1 Tax=Medicago truncatula TaxID=3880 RepID=A0A072TK49_MEDTR|nr:hypothetical protein MTR_0028s0290 [Medicago truncatula]